MADVPTNYEQCFFLGQGLRVRSSPHGGLGVFSEREFQPLQILALERHIFAAAQPSLAFQRAKGRLCPRAGEAAWLRYGETLNHALSDLLKIHLNSYMAGLFDFGSKFNHSCAPNAGRVTWEDGLSAILALQRIPPGSEVTVSYIDTEGPRFLRRLRLLTSHGFWCQCNRCFCNGAPEEALKLPADVHVKLLPSELALYKLCEMDKPAPSLAFSQAVARCKAAFEVGARADGLRFGRVALEAAENAGGRRAILEHVLLGTESSGALGFQKYDDAVEPAVRLLNAFFQFVILTCSALVILILLVFVPDLRPQVDRQMVVVAMISCALPSLHLAIAFLGFLEFEEHLCSGIKKS